MARGRGRRGGKSMRTARSSRSFTSKGKKRRGTKIYFTGGYRA